MQFTCLSCLYSEISSNFATLAVGWLLRQLDRKSSQWLVVRQETAKLSRGDNLIGAETDLCLVEQIIA